MFWVGHSSTHDEDHTRHVARALHALSRGVDELREWYTTFTNHPVFDETTQTPSNHPRFFPFADRFPIRDDDFDAPIIEFEYISPLQEMSTCVTFLAKTRESAPRDIVVKFVQRYCPDVHDILAKATLAPARLYHGRVTRDVDYGNWEMVVMEYFEGRPSYVEDRHKHFDVSEKVLEAIKLVHSKGYVLGDVRPPNVLVGDNGEVKLIDFDWAGEWKEDNSGVRYPAYISEDNIWSPGIGRMKCIEKEHDLSMHQKWFSPNSPSK